MLCVSIEWLDEVGWKIQSNLFHFITSTWKKQNNLCSCPRTIVKLPVYIIFIDAPGSVTPEKIIFRSNDQYLQILQCYAVYPSDGFSTIWHNLVSVKKLPSLVCIHYRKRKKIKWITQRASKRASISNKSKSNTTKNTEIDKKYCLYFHILAESVHTLTCIWRSNMFFLEFLSFRSYCSLCRLILKNFISAINGLS